MFGSNSVELNNFSMEVVSDDFSVRKVTKNDSHYYVLPNRSTYKLRLSNNTSNRSDVTISIDSVEVGKWRINPYRSILIERPSNIDRKFVFVADNSHIARSNGIIAGDDKNGLIKVVFEPEDYYSQFLDSDHCGISHKMRRPFGNDQMYDSGATVLGAKSHQQFGEASRIQKYDTNNTTMIYARLVIERDRYIPLGSMIQTNIPQPVRDGMI
jgi:hypothetical protein